jgi:DNA-binding NarL/FixJ family response regulator
VITEVVSVPTAVQLPQIQHAHTALGTLTPREVEVLRLMADGLSTRTIAVRLSISFKTAACHRYRILQKVGVESTVSAVRWAIRCGLVEP